MTRIMLLAWVAMFFAADAKAHSVHDDCRTGSAWMGRVDHFHPGKTGRAVACKGVHRAHGRECYTDQEKTTCCPQGWTIHDGRCQPFPRY